MVVHSSEIYTSIVNLFFHVSLCVVMSLCQKLNKDHNVYACDENKSSVTQNPFATFSALNISGVLFLQLSLPYSQPCCVSLLLWSRFVFWSCCQGQPRQLWLAISGMKLGWELKARRTLPSGGRRSCWGAAAEVSPKGLGSSWQHKPSPGYRAGKWGYNGSSQMCIQWTCFFLIIAAPKTSHQVSLS